MPIPRFVAGMIPVAITVLSMSAAYGQNYPNKPIRVVCAEIGGSADFEARLIAQGLATNFHESVVVDNRPAILMGEIVAKAPADGYTVLVAGGTFMYAPLLREMPYDPVRDFSPITITSRSPLVLAVHPSVPVESVKELIVLAQAKPGALNYASAGTGSILQLAAELFKSMAGVSIVRISYKGTGQANNALLGNQVHMVFSTAASVLPHVKSSRLKALAVTSAQPSVLVPGVPTVGASGLPGYEVDQMGSMLAPAKTPGATIRRLNQEIGRVLNQPHVKTMYLSGGIEATPGSPEELSVNMKSNRVKWGKLIKDAGIKAD